MDGAAGLLRAFERQGACDAAVQRLDEVAPTPTGLDQLSSLPAGGPAFHLPSGDINLASGARVALVGPSGCGKTQIVERLLALRPDPDHTVRFGGEPVERLSPLHLRAQFAYAPQDAMALSGTVRDNLLLGRADATEADLWQVLHLAVLDQRVTALPKGLDTWVGEAGEALSGGERKRLSVARALLRTAAWLVLDEPSEGLDATTEALLLERLRARLDATGQGLILVSHRLPPLALCSERISVSSG
jgi:ATP-binding cassette subfamily C protein CydC